MENVRAFFNILHKSLNSHSEAGTAPSCTEHLDDVLNFTYAIQNKLISLPNKDSITMYAKMLSRVLDNEYFCLLDFLEPEKMDTSELVMEAENFVINIISSFNDCGEDITQYLKEQVYGDVIDYEAMRNLPWSKEYAKKRNDARKCVNEFTLYRKKHAIMAMLEALNVRAGNCGTISQAEAQRFIYFLTGNGTMGDDIRNLSVSDLFKPSKDYRSDKTIKEDCEFVALYFERLGLIDIADKVRK